MKKSITNNFKAISKIIPGYKIINQKRLFLNLFLICFLTVFLTLGLQNSQSKENQSLLWKVEYTPDKTYTYIMGSIHIGRKDMYPLKDYIEKAYKNSESLVLEIDMNKVNPMDLMKLMTYQNDNTLKSKLEPDTYSRLSKVFVDNNLPEVVFNKFKPWAAILTAQQLAMKDLLTDDIAPGIDMYFMEKANKDKKEVEELETAEFQMSLFDDFDLIANEYIDYSLEQLDNNNEIEELMTSYINSDIDALDKLINKTKGDFLEYDKILEKILYERNIQMYKKISNWLKTDRKIRFIVVGAGHLVGNKSILSEFEKDSNYKITNIVE